MLYKHYLLVFAPCLSDDKRINTLILHTGFYNLKKQSYVQKQWKPRFSQFLHFSACVWLVQPKPSTPWMQLHSEKQATAFLTEMLEMVEMTRTHVTDEELWSQDWAAAGTGEAAMAPGRNRGPDEPETREGRTAAGFERGGGQHFTALFKYTSQRPSEK